MNSPAFDLVSSAEHPAPENGGPCATCAFRPGSEASRTPHTVELAKACVEGLRPFQCHEKPQLCRGFIAAANVRGPAKTKAEKRHVKAAAFVADMLGQIIEFAAEADRAHARGDKPR